MSESVLERTVGDVLRDAAREAPNVRALVEIGLDGVALRTWTYAELLREAEQVASALLARFSPGEHVALWAPNLPEWVLLEYGCALAGLVLVTVNPAYRRAELSYVLEQSDSVGVFYTPEFRGSPMEQFLEQSLPNLPKIREAISLTGWDAFIASAASVDSLPAVSADDPVQIQYTSGTTGKPKGAVLRHRGVTNNMRFAASRAGVTDGEVFLNFMPLFHTAGCVFAVLSQAVTRSTLVLLPTFDPALVLDSIAAHRATALFAVPTMLIALLDELQRESRDLSSLRRVISAGSTVPAPLVHQVRDQMGVERALARAGCENVWMGAESGSQTTAGPAVSRVPRSGVV
jgi:fatty-acyl-CoA synthase